mmetsp:Transcript_7707/g.16495  ORF Transcript_7707/g.16495 Transcript_7707/m.16495 type:complete len:109 (+) Transcript_7707:144-470(+)
MLILIQIRLTPAKKAHPSENKALYAHLASALQHPELQKTPFLSGIILHFQFTHPTMTSGPTCNEVQMFQQDSLSFIRFFKSKRIQKVYKDVSLLLLVGSTAVCERTHK